MTDLSHSSVYVAGHRGMVGTAIVSKLKAQGYTNLVLAGRNEVDLRDQTVTLNFLQNHRPDVVIVAAAKVGGIIANQTLPAEFIYDNLMIECNLIHQAFKSGVEKIVFLGSSCIYPKLAEQPMQESALLDGKLELTNEPYAIAKIAGIKLCESYNRQYGTDYRSLMPTNLYGPGDNFHPELSHVIPGLLGRFHDAKQSNAEEVLVWGTGNARREFLHVDDLASATLHVLELDNLSKQVGEQQTHINVGTGSDITIADLAHTVSDIVGFKGQIRFDDTKPDGTPRKLLDTQLLANLGWQSTIELDSGLATTYRWFLDNFASLRS